MLHLILDHKLIRFSATVRAADVWFGLMWDVASPHVITTTLERALDYLENSDARRQAMVASGGFTQAAELTREQRSLPWVEGVLADPRN